MTAPSPELIADTVTRLTLESLREGFKKQSRETTSSSGLNYFYNAFHVGAGSENDAKAAVEIINNDPAVAEQRRALERDGIFAKMVSYFEFSWHIALFVEYDDRGRKILMGS